MAVSVCLFCQERVLLRCGNPFGNFSANAAKKVIRDYCNDAFILTDFHTKFKGRQTFFFFLNSTDKFWGVEK